MEQVLHLSYEKKSLLQATAYGRAMPPVAAPLATPTRLGLNAYSYSRIARSQNTLGCKKPARACPMVLPSCSSRAFLLLPIKRPCSFSSQDAASYVHEFGVYIIYILFTFSLDIQPDFKRLSAGFSPASTLFETASQEIAYAPNVPPAAFMQLTSYL